MIGVNKVILLGNVGTVPEIKYLEGGVCVASFRLATTESFKDKNGNKVEQTEWHTIVAWRGLGEVVEKIIKKGSQIYVEGRLRTRQWDDKDGHKKNATDIVAEQINVINHRKEENETHSPPTTSNKSEGFQFISSQKTPSIPSAENDAAGHLPF